MFASFSDFNIGLGKSFLPSKIPFPDQIYQQAFKVNDGKFISNSALNVV